MSHMLARLRNVKPEVIKNVLRRDADQHAKEGLTLEYLWQNADDKDEVLFLFRTTDLDRAKQFIDRVHSRALRENPDSNLPQMIYLEEN